MRGPTVREVLLASAVAGTVSGAPSAVHALATGRSPLGAARAAGALPPLPQLVDHVAFGLATGATLARVRAADAAAA